MTDLPDLEGPPMSHIPGNIVSAAPFFFTHEMGIESVSATFVNQDNLGATIKLRGRQRKEYPDRLTDDGRIIKHSSTHLWTKIPGNAVPGMYNCRAVVAHTYGGNSISFEDPNNEVNWTFWVLAEEDTPPKFGHWQPFTSVCAGGEIWVVGKGETS